MSTYDPIHGLGNLFFRVYRSSKTRALAMASVISRNVNRLRNAHRKISCLKSLAHCRSSTQSPLLDNRHIATICSGVYFGPVNQLQSQSKFIYGRCMFSTDAAARVNSESSKKHEENKSDGGEKSGDSHQGSDAGKPVRGGPVSWLSFLLLVATGAGIIFYYDKEKKKHIEEINKRSEAVKEGPSAGKAAIGGPFNLIDHNGKHVTEKDFKGKWTMIYFGFTHCPDICPDELQKLAAAIDKIKEKAGFEIVPLFISVDPERDTVEQVCEYVKEFHPKLIGLTGNPDEIRKAARAYRVYYMKTVEEDSDYLVDHSIVMYLMGPDMDFVKFFGKNNDVDSLADGVIKEIKQYKPRK